MLAMPSENRQCQCRRNMGGQLIPDPRCRGRKRFWRRYSKVLVIVSHRYLTFLHFICFCGQGIHCRHSYWATMFGWSRKFRSTSGTGGTRRYWWLCFIDFWNFSTIKSVIKVSIDGILTERPCLGDLENPHQLPVHEVLEGTDDCV